MIYVVRQEGLGLHEMLDHQAFVSGYVIYQEWKGAFHSAYVANPSNWEPCADHHRALLEKTIITPC